MEVKTGDISLLAYLKMRGDISSDFFGSRIRSSFCTPKAVTSMLDMSK